MVCGGILVWRSSLPYPTPVWESGGDGERRNSEKRASSSSIWKFSWSSLGSKVFSYWLKPSSECVSTLSGDSEISWVNSGSRSSSVVRSIKAASDAFGEREIRMASVALGSSDNMGGFRSFSSRVISFRRFSDGRASCSSPSCLFRFPSWLMAPGSQIGSLQSRLPGQDFCRHALICKLYISFRWYKNDVSLSSSRLHKGWGHFLGQQTVARCAPRWLHNLASRVHEFRREEAGSSLLPRQKGQNAGRKSVLQYVMDAQRFEGIDSKWIRQCRSHSSSTNQSKHAKQYFNSEADRSSMLASSVWRHPWIWVFLWGFGKLPRLASYTLREYDGHYLIMVWPQPAIGQRPFTGSLPGRYKVV